MPYTKTLGDKGLPVVVPPLPSIEDRIKSALRHVQYTFPIGATTRYENLIKTNFFGDHAAEHTLYGAHFHKYECANQHLKKDNQWQLYIHDKKKKTSLAFQYMSL